MNDYPHFGVWPDGYYMTVNQFNGNSFGWAGGGVAVFEREAMLDGLDARMIYIDLGAVTKNYGGMLPSDLDGTPPAQGTPNFFMEWDDSSWLGDPTDTLRIWEFKTDWNNPANTTFGLNEKFDPNYIVPTSDVDPDLCGYNRSCIPQPSTTQGLDAISDRLMYRLQYRNFGDHQTLVGNHTVDANGSDKAGIHWFELRDSGSGFVLYQDGVYAPDSDNRWMGSAAMDVSGDIALGFSVSSATTHPSIRYAGRLTDDPKGILPQGEASLIEGSGSQTHGAARWGDYSMLAVDPSDGCTFWFTSEYIQSTGEAPWQTRIGSFRLPSCTTEPVGYISGTVTDSLSNPIAGATIMVPGGFSTITDEFGHYKLALVTGSYTIEVSKYGYVTANASGLSVTPPDTTQQDFQLVNSPSHTISGVVTDKDAGWPLYARIDIYGYPDSPIFTDPETGAYTVTVYDYTYTFKVTALSGGYIPEELLITVSADAVQDFALSVDSLACNAPGYIATPPDFSENFNAWPPTGWTIVNNIPDGIESLVWNASSFYYDGNYTGGDGDAAGVDSMWFFGNFDTELISPAIDPATLSHNNLVYKANYQKNNLDALDLDFKNVSDTSWTNILHWNENHGTYFSAPGETVAVDLTPYITGEFQLRWHYYTPQDNPYDIYAQVDDVTIGTGCIPTPSTGLIVGSVYDANTGLAAVHADVVDAMLNPVIWIDTTADPAAIAPLYIIANPVGEQMLTASASDYGTVNEFPVVEDGDTVRQDFYLPAGQLSTNPDSLTFDAGAFAPTSSQPVTVENVGGLPADFEVFAIRGTYSAPVPTGPFAPHTRHFGPKNLNDRDAANIRMNFTPPNIPIINGGTVIDSWPTNLNFAWGIGFNTEANDLWLSDMLGAGGDGYNHRFTTDGINTGDMIDTNSWVTFFGADMTYNPFTNKLWQVNVGGDNCIYELDPALKISTGKKICPPFGTSERGLAFNPLTNTYYAGSWNDGILNHFAPDGTLLDSVNVGLSISGLAFNPGTGHLFAMTNGGGSPDVYVLDVNDNYNIIGAFYLESNGSRVFNDSGQAGLEIDCDGNLWAVNQGKQVVYKAASGETGACDYLATWLSASPVMDSITNGATTTFDANVDATGLQPGIYIAYLRVISDTPYADKIIPVELGVHTFADVPVTHDAWNFIEILYTNKLTSGCATNPLRYCPASTVARDQMAIFLERGKRGPTFWAPVVPITFTDTTTNTMRYWIEQLKTDGITTGCNTTGDKYCPSSNVTRAQMAIFLLRAKYGSAYTPPAVGSSSGFNDVPVTYWAAPWIKQLAAEGITAGCGGGNYCPLGIVNRAQMAIFLVRAFDLK